MSTASVSEQKLMQITIYNSNFGFCRATGSSHEKSCSQTWIDVKFDRGSRHWVGSLRFQLESCQKLQNKMNCFASVFAMKIDADTNQCFRQLSGQNGENLRL